MSISTVFSKVKRGSVAVAMCGLLSCAYNSSSATNFSQAIHWDNPCFPEYSHNKMIAIPNGSVLNYASNGIAGYGIRAASKLNSVPNPLGISHSGVAFHVIPKNLMNDIISLMHVKGTHLFENPGIGNEMIKKVVEQYPDAKVANSFVNKKSAYMMQVFCAEAGGTAGELLHGMYPHIYVVPLEYDAMNYSGNIYVRPLSVLVDQEESYEVVKKYLGTPYEGGTSFLEMVKAVRNLNIKDNTSKLFCSEFAALYYRDLGLINKQTIVSNVIPEELSSGAAEYDILKSVAVEDVAIREESKFIDFDCDSCCCGFF